MTHALAFSPDSCSDAGFVGPCRSSDTLPERSLALVEVACKLVLLADGPVAVADDDDGVVAVELDVAVEVVDAVPSSESSSVSTEMSALSAAACAASVASVCAASAVHSCIRLVLLERLK